MYQEKQKSIFENYEKISASLFQIEININFYKSWCVTLSPQGSGTISEEGSEKLEEPDVGEDPGEPVPSGHDWTPVLTNLMEVVSVYDLS